MTNSTHALVMPRSVRAGAASVAIIGTIAIATVAFTLSFTALTELVHAHSSARDHAWMWAVGVDGLIVVATIALVAMTGTTARERAWALTLLIAGVLLSTIGNVVHALLNGYGPIGAIIAAVPPLMLAAVTHPTVQVLRHALAPTSARSSAHDVDQVHDDVTRQDLEDVEHELALATPAAHATPTRSQPVTVQITTTPSARTRTEADHRALARWILEREHQGLTTTGVDIEQHHGCSEATGRRWKAAAATYLDDERARARDNDRSHELVLA